jgi:hypothetical protein
MKVKVRDSETGAPQILDLRNNTISMRDEGSGRMITMDLGIPDVHLDRALATYAAGYRFIDFECIADEVAPVTLTPFASDKFFNWDKDDILQDADDIVVGPGGTVKEITPRLSSAAFQTVSYGIGAFVPNELQGNADSPLSLQQAATARCLTVLKQARERRVAALVGTGGSWTGGYTTTLGATAKWNSGSASAPVQDIFALQEGSLSPVKTVIMSEPVYHGFAANTNVQKFFVSKTNTPAMAGDATNGAQAQSLADLIGVQKVLVSRRKGKTASGYGYIWGSNAVGVYNEPSTPTNGQVISTARTFRWNGANGNVPDGAMVGGMMVRTYQDPTRGARGGQKVVVVHNDAEVMTSVFCGGLIISAWQ